MMDEGMKAEVETVSYMSDKKQLAVLFKDGSACTHLHVERPAIDALFASASIDHHYRKYIQNIYLKETALCPK